GNTTVEATDVPIEAGQWYHVVSTCSATNARIYVNGELAGSTTIASTPIVSNTFPVVVGRNRTAYNEWWDGRIDEVMVLPSILSADQVREMYANGIAGKSPMTNISFSETTAGDTWHKDAVEETAAGAFIAPVSVGTTTIITGPGAVCGDGTLEEGEVCDDGEATDSGTCNATCTALTFCGDGTIQSPNGEGVAETVCDDGATNGTVAGGCNYECTGTLPIGCSPELSGDGSDGSLTVASLNTIVNNYAHLTADVVSGASSITVNDALAFTDNQEILILQMQDASGSNEGTYEFAQIDSIAVNTITLVNPLINGYASTPASANTTAATITQIVQVPNYTDVTVDPGASITATVWTGLAGGVIAFRATGNTIVNGTITASNTGFLGGARGICTAGSRDGFQGTSFEGNGVRSVSANEGGGGGGHGDTGSCGGAGGAGGSYGTLGEEGNTETYCHGATRAIQGSVYGVADLSKLFLGSGGGGGGSDNDCGHEGGPAGRGGGIVWIAGTDTLTVNGTITNNGQQGTAAENGAGGDGAGGSGGSLYLAAHTMDLGDNLVQSVGGARQVAFNDGGAGGVGRIRLHNALKSGATSPVSFESALCSAAAVCGNGIIEFGETCDDGGIIPGDGCDATCQIEPPPLCGDGVLDVGEECDDGNILPGDGCDASCQIEPFCGDGVVDPGEQCDDGNILPGDGCDGSCQVEAACGDGSIDPGEACDDGNIIPGDGCDASCQIEIECGNGLLEGGEECDDNNIAPGDGCNTSCEIERELGDAPDSRNHTGPSPGTTMTAYPKNGPFGVSANFPVVFDPGLPLGTSGRGFCHNASTDYLGTSKSYEADADQTFDEDVIANIDSLLDLPDRDEDAQVNLRDDGLSTPSPFALCALTPIQVQGTTSSASRYL
ncbi:MAG: DUF4215 domain-containing protein, partial [Candidatus Gracilibacteria bacterium]|nr:DUF4215 domain-containing protein [Candidatus Gracilibacteria bacterium]